MNSPTLTISVVTYNTPQPILFGCLDSILNTQLPLQCIVIDNARDPAVESRIVRIKEHLPDPGVIEYIPSENIGFGRAHNVAIRKILNNRPGRYHAVINPDVAFGPETLETLADFMNQHPDAALAMPRIRYPDGSDQRLCKLLPTPGHLLARRFFPGWVKKQNTLYQLEFADYNLPFECPSLSGCFMFLRTESLKQAGLFDERFFMYFEDVDLVRRVGQYGKTLYCPFATVTHHYEKGSYSSTKLLLNHLASGVKYFNKWGWFIDRKRSRLNGETVRRLRGCAESVCH